jgi:mannosyl-oligosaccharide alpha-1,2-mannosidase
VIGAARLAHRTAGVYGAKGVFVTQSTRGNGGCDVRVTDRLDRRTLLRALAGSGALAAATQWLGAPPSLAAVPDPAAPDAGVRPPNRVIAAQVRTEFLRAWNAYQQLAFGRDELLPVAGVGSDFFAEGHPVGLTIVEALDTLFLMELDDDLRRGVLWCEQNLSFDIDADFQVFETIIRMVGGLLSGFHATGRRSLLKLATDLADRLLPAFTASPTGAPYRFVNLRTGAVSGPENVLAEIGTNVAEFGDLTRLTGDPKYLDASKRAFRAVVDRRSALDLVGTTFNVETGAWVNHTATIDPPVDSFFEYLFDGFDLLGDRQLLAWYQLLTAAVLRHERETFGGNLWFRRVDMDTGALVARRTSELTSFYAGLLGQSGHFQLGAAYHDSWTAVAARFPLIPEGFDYSTFTATGPGNQLRPEYVDAAFNLWLVSGQETYRDRAFAYFQRVKRICSVPNGYTIATDVTTTPVTLGDLTSAYWFSENMKYYYLMFANSPRFDYRHNYLTTEGNVLRGLRRP